MGADRDRQPRHALLLESRRRTTPPDRLIVSGLSPARAERWRRRSRAAACAEGTGATVTAASTVLLIRGYRLDDVRARRQPLPQHHTPHAPAHVARVRRGDQRDHVPEGREPPGHGRLQVPRRVRRRRGALQTAQASGVVTFSSGNHAQALASPAAARRPRRDHDARRRTARQASGHRGYGAEIVTFDRYRQVGGSLVRRGGARPLPSRPLTTGRDGRAGHGALKELIEDALHFDMLLVCLGGGGLLAGCALAAKATARRTCASSASSLRRATTCAARWRPASACGSDGAAHDRRRPAAPRCRAS